MTGWAWITELRSRAKGPILKLATFDNGTLIKLATGFWVALARSPAEALVPGFSASCFCCWGVSWSDFLIKVRIGLLSGSVLVGN